MATDDRGTLLMITLRTLSQYELIRWHMSNNRESAVEGIRLLQATLEALDKVERELGEALARECPFCGNWMQDLKPWQSYCAAYNNKDFYSDVDVQAFPALQRWECQSCLVIDTYPPSDYALSWSAENPAHNKSFAAEIFQAFPFVTEVVLINKSSPHPRWYLKAGATWYTITGNKEQIRKQWSLK
jgi:hypothetical protein